MKTRTVPKQAWTGATTRRNPVLPARTDRLFGQPAPDPGATANSELLATTRTLPPHQGRSVSDRELFDVARQAKAKAVVPMSGFAVGAAAVTKSGKILSAANLETSDRSGGGGTCAENFIAFQLSGEKLDTLVITSDSPECISPCGGCCQTLSEIASPDARVVMTSKSGEMKVTTVAELLAGPSRLATHAELTPHSDAVVAAIEAFDDAESGSGNIKPYSAVVVDDDGAMFTGATRKQSGAYSRAVQMAVDSRFLAKSKSRVSAFVFAGRGEGPLDVPLPSGRDRQEMFNLGPNRPVVLINVETGDAAITTPKALLPKAYVRD